MTDAELKAFAEQHAPTLAKPIVEMVAKVIEKGLVGIIEQAARERLAAAPTPDSVPCEDCGGSGVIGDEIYQGEFQPPERERCSSCDGSGRWHVSPDSKGAAEPVARAYISHRACMPPILDYAATPGALSVTTLYELPSSGAQAAGQEDAS